MKHDFSKCNNLQFKANVQGIEKEGYLKISNEENVYMFISMKIRLSIPHFNLIMRYVVNPLLT